MLVNLTKWPNSPLIIGKSVLKIPSRMVFFHDSQVKENPHQNLNPNSKILNFKTLIFYSLLSPEPQRPKSLVLDNLPGLVGSLVTSPATSNSPSSRDSQKRPLLLPDLEEIRLSPLISKKGYLNILDHKTKVCYALIY